jgi:hypothetical protein
VRGHSYKVARARRRCPFLLQRIPSGFRCCDPGLTRALVPSRSVNFPEFVAERIFSKHLIDTRSGALVESQGPLAILWVGLGLCCFYIALVWLNTLLGFFLTPLFIIPATWLMDWRKRRQEQEKGARKR